MIELIEVHEPTNSVKRVLKKSSVSEHAQFYTETYILEDGSKHPYSSDINMMYGKTWNKFTGSVNVVFGNPDNEFDYSRGGHPDIAMPEKTAAAIAFDSRAEKPKLNILERFIKWLES